MTDGDGGMSDNPLTGWHIVGSQGRFMFEVLAANFKAVAQFWTIKIPYKLTCHLNDFGV